MPALQVGQYIVSKGGAVTAEQLAPYLDVQLDDLERVDGQINESFVVSCSALVAAPFVVQGASLPEGSAFGMGLLVMCLLVHSELLTKSSNGCGAQRVSTTTEGRVANETSAILACRLVWR